MKIISYELFPEAYKSKGSFQKKEGTVGELLYDIGILMYSDYDKVIPPLKELNKILLKGEFPRGGQWKPFEIDIEEYNEVVEYLCGLPLARPFSTYDSI